jgi:hypothetical protein
MAVLGEPVNESGRQVSVLQKGTPVGEAQIGSDQRWLFAMPFVHQREEKPHLNRFDLYLADFVNQQAVVGEIFGKQFGFGMIGTGSVRISNSYRSDQYFISATMRRLPTAAYPAFPEALRL